MKEGIKVKGKKEREIKVEKSGIMRKKEGRGNEERSEKNEE